MKFKLVIFLGGVFLFFAFRNNEGTLMKMPENFPEPIYDFSKNELKKEKIELGRALFYDPILSRNNTISCASCHSPYNAFTHVDHDLSHGIEDKIGTRNSPALMNLAWSKSFMWDGSIHHLDMQALAPISHPLEMDNTLENVVSALNKSQLYKNAFHAAYDDSLITGERVLKSISQFMLTLVSANSKYDRVMKSSETFTAQEESGYKLFKTNCSSCHKEPLFTNGDFANNGLEVDTTLNDYGKMTITKKSNDSLKFKIPTLRNIEFSYPYMHDGRFKKLSDVIHHYADDIQKSATLGPELQSLIILTSSERVDLLAFLLTLTDREFLFNPDFGYPKTFFSVKTKD